jgi:hypothetical protein
MGAMAGYGLCPVAGFDSRYYFLMIPGDIQQIGHSGVGFAYFFHHKRVQSIVYFPEKPAFPLPKNNVIKTVICQGKLLHGIRLCGVLHFANLCLKLAGKKFKALPVFGVPIQNRAECRFFYHLPEPDNFYHIIASQKYGPGNGFSGNIGLIAEKSTLGDLRFEYSQMLENLYRLPN